MLEITMEQELTGLSVYDNTYEIHFSTTTDSLKPGNHRNCSCGVQV